MAFTDLSTLSNKSLSFYDILGVDKDSSENEIRQAFYDICRRYHPDKTGNSFGSSQLEHWSAIQTAWKCLSNTTKRKMYDIKLDNRVMSKSETEIVLVQQESQRRVDIENMKTEYQTSLEREGRSGVKIIRAEYGHLFSDESKHIIDVSIPLQVVIDNHRLILPGGISKSHLRGFYDPIPSSIDTKPRLYVSYIFKGTTHEVTIDDEDVLWIPLRSHIVRGDMKGPLALIKNSDNDKHIKTNYTFLFTSIIFGIYGISKHFQIPLNTYILRLYGLIRSYIIQ